MSSVVVTVIGIVSTMIPTDLEVLDLGVHGIDKFAREVRLQSRPKPPCWLVLIVPPADSLIAVSFSLHSCAALLLRESFA